MRERPPDRKPGSRESVDLWVPEAGDIVAMKKGFEGSLDAHAFHRAGVHELKEEGLYRVVDYIQDEERRALKLQEVHVVTVGGKRYETPAGSVLSFTPPLDLFELRFRRQKE